MAISQHQWAQALNRSCQCVGTDLGALHAWLDSDLKQRGFTAPIVTSHPHLFSASPVFIATEQAAQMRSAIAAIESAIARPAYRQKALARAPQIARHPQSTRGVFLGYDFHLTAAGPRLIEINTNAGGALLNVAMMRAQHACCPQVHEYLQALPSATTLEDRLVAMFMDEWRLARGAGTPACLAIVDDAPESQYLYPEFLLFVQAFAARGIDVVIAPSRQLRFAQGALWFDQQRIDMVYNRLTDFYLQLPEHAPLAQAYLDDAVVVTPHPQSHALYANKHNLISLSDEQELAESGVAEDVRKMLLHSIPRTLAIASKDEALWWSERKQWFFKPASGFGSRGSYRGDKLTRSVFAEILRGDYIVQQCVPASERWIGKASDARALKFDVRNYVYANQVQLLAARLYQGQTTNFRTHGGGFAPVYQSSAAWPLSRAGQERT